LDIVRPSEALIAVSVGLVHLAMIGAVDRFAGQQESAGSDTSSAAPLSVTILSTQGTMLGHVLPRPQLLSPALEVPTLTEFIFEEPEGDEVPGIIGAASAPHPFLELPATIAALHAARAGLIAGESVTVVLSVEVFSDGSVGQVSVQSSSGNPSADLEAIALAREMRWFPGTLRRHALGMRVQYSVTLTGSS
jgi:TonB family protein